MATFSIASGVGASSTSIDLGTITDEQEIYNAGTTVIPLTFSGSQGNYTYNVSGASREIVIQGMKSATQANLRIFSADLKLICDYENSSATNSYFTYTNTNSNISDVYSGVRVKMMDYRIRQTNTNAVTIISYTIRLVQTR